MEVEVVVCPEDHVTTLVVMITVVTAELPMGAIDEAGGAGGAVDEAGGTISMGVGSMIKVSA